MNYAEASRQARATGAKYILINSRGQYLTANTIPTGYRVVATLRQLLKGGR